MTRKLSGIIGELKFAEAVSFNKCRFYIPYNGNNKDDDFAVVNEKTGNVYRIQVKAKQDKKKWSKLYFKGISKECNKSLIYVLVEHRKKKEDDDRFFVIKCKDLVKIKADEEGFDHNDRKNKKYQNNWSLLE